MLTLVARRPELLTAEMLEQLIQLWQLISPVQLLSVLSPSTLMLLSRAADNQLVWSKVSSIVDPFFIVNYYIKVKNSWTYSIDSTHNSILICFVDLGVSFLFVQFFNTINTYPSFLGQ